MLGLVLAGRDSVDVEECPALDAEEKPTNRAPDKQLLVPFQICQNTAALMIGTTLAHYRITGHLGTGGMGEVYEATDSKLGRSVAIKFLPEAFAQDAERVARFQREARVPTSLDHPKIASIHELEEIGGRHFLLMAGETLAERIRRGPVPVEEALGIVRQIADALDAAHEKGVVHRDLKPPNIKITPDVTVKVLDFGLAKAYGSDPASGINLSNSPTRSHAATRQGVILGTAAYMRPEQARGKSVDRRRTSGPSASSFTKW
jgi:serine/threonine protein kinase